MLVELQSYLEKKLCGKIENSLYAYGELTISIKLETLLEVMLFLRDDSRCQFTGFVDLAGVDYPQQEKRFHIVYHLLSARLNHRIRVKVSTDKATAVTSICAVYAAAEWYEREAYDMYGILFSGNPDLRRILTDYGFEGHPLRKDFPVSGFVECRYDSDLKKIVYEPVVLKQQIRNFDALSPWGGYPTVEKQNTGG